MKPRSTFCIYKLACLRQLIFLLGCCCLTPTAAQSAYYINRGSGTRSPLISGEGNGVLDSLQRGQEGLLVQLDSLDRAIKEDELKLNNVFYKLGLHDKDIQTAINVQLSLKESSRKLETKLNKQSYNIDFLRRHVTEFKRVLTESSVAATTISALQTTVVELQKSLAEALYRTGQLENKTSTLEAQQHLSLVPGIDHNNLYYASKTPKTTYYYVDPDVIESYCDEASGWMSTTDGGCWYVGGPRDEKSFVDAMSACTSKGGVLAGLPLDGSGWPADLNKKFIDKLRVYWTSATDSITPGVWVYLSSGVEVQQNHWAAAQPIRNSSTSTVPQCGGYTTTGLAAMPCNATHSFVCRKL